MSADRHARIKAIFLEACALPLEQRPAFLSRVCANDADIRREVDRLLSHHAKPADAAEPTHVTEVPADFMEAPHFSTGHLIADRYRIVALLGEGGMGKVYRAEDLSLNLTVALKFMPRLAGLDPVWRRRIEREVKLSRAVSHTNVCRVFDLGEVDGIPFISMEFVDGEDLSALLRRIDRLTGDRAVAIARQICAGLAASHAQGVLHRDLKPSNVMLDGKGDVRITDFGLAVVAGRIDRAEMPAGTPRYMAPELFTGVPASEQSDIYALGLVLYELFTGKPVYMGKGAAEYSRLHRTGEPVPPSTLVPEIDPKVEAIILACLRKDPAERPASVLHVAAALPGGSLLAAALDAGEIPTREMLAAAAAEGTVSRGNMTRVAVAALALFLMAIPLGYKTHPIAKVDGAKSPEVLRDKAREIAVERGLAATSVDSEIRYLSATEIELSSLPLDSPRSRALLSAAGAGPLFCYLESHSTPIPGEVDLLRFIMPGTEPSPLLPSALGMTNIVLDATGRLVWFDSDGMPSTSIEPTSRSPDSSPASFASNASRWAFLKAARNLVLLVLLIAALPAAWRSWRRRGDLVGAVRVGGFIFVVRLVVALLSIRRISVGVDALDILVQTFASALAEAAIVSLFYLALERHVRRLWPRTLGCWSRILTGTFRDPFVGRDVLIGCLVGCFWAVIIFADRRLPAWMGWEVRSQLRIDQSLNNLLGPRFGIAGSFDSVRSGIYHGMAMLLVLVLAMWIAGRRKGPALMIAWIIGSIMYAPAATHPVMAWTIYAFGAVGVAVYLLTRWGLVSLLAALLIVELLGVVPITADLSAWYSGYGLFGMAVTLGLGAWAFHQSRQPSMPDIAPLRHS